MSTTKALKGIIADKAANPELRARFVLEAEINGNLEHPGIVPEYGLGTYRDPVSTPSRDAPRSAT
jgi:eukaryotic-like serine/threonine-protein kinase